jgi:hypothetical protein
MPARSHGGLTDGAPRAGTDAGSRPGLAAATGLALLAMLAWLGSHFYPSTEAVRVRNAFLVVRGTPADFDWRPPAVPRGFLQQAGAPPAPMRAAAAATSGPALERTVALVNALNPGKRRGGPIQRSTAEAFAVITATGTGYCGDYTQVVNGLAWAAGLPVREWGMSFDGFGGDGHAFNEVWDAARGQWIMVDVFNGFWVRDRASGAPLSALDFRERLALAEPLQAVELVKFRPAELGFRSPADMIGYYRRGVDQFYLWWGNNVFDLDGHPLVRAARPLGRAAGQAAAMLAGVHPGIRVLPTPTNGALLAALEATRVRVLVLAAACVALAAALAAQFLLWRRTRRAR